ncbi:hypothetical protein SynSYN20_01660 [Synechococcus sp. SYN20]|uniref:hypothetical protein n=1 Tax=Synechococcus sp. SYN20 TaxID=1050714 RepID=UPI0016442B56|nr:hypothetical protein [Synechococcus sp. SYN20]QNJ25987.1 hypothetical protein SynSYN20_01660 [Synechococcus sp. SYN20]
MAWLNNTAVRCTVSINGADYSDEFTGGSLSDSSVVQGGFVTTGGSLTFQDLPGFSRLEDYDDTKFGRGGIVTIDLQTAGSEMRRHPRGHLRVITATYSPETRSMTVEVGCLLTLHNLTNDITNLKYLTVFDLPNEAGMSDLSAALASESKFAWQKSDGSIQLSSFFGSDGLGSNKYPARWVSVRDQTAIASQPLGGGNPIPDLIRCTYTWATVESDDGGGGDGPAEDIDETVSVYWLEHPAQLKKTQKICTTDLAGTRTCRQVEVNDGKKSFSVTKTNNSRRVYGALGASLSSEISITEGPAVELAGGYFGELYAFKLARANYVAANVPLDGLNTVVQEKREKSYVYGTGGEVLKTIEYTYRNYISAMTTNDWRAGTFDTGSEYDPENPPSQGTRGFLTDIPSDKLYLSQKVTTEWEYFDDRTIEKKSTLQSSAQCNGVGIFPTQGERILENIDATNNGVETSQTRTSRGGLLNPDQPPRNPGTAAISTKSEVYENESAKYTPTTAGSIVLNTSVPYTNLGDTESQARTRAAAYTQNQRQLLEGDAAGIRVAESMREEIFDYYPGMPFSFFDPTLEKLIKLRMNATGWALSTSQAIFSTDGVFIGVSNGTVTLPSNVDAVSANNAFEEVLFKRNQTEIAEDAFEVADQACDVDLDLLAAIEEEQAERLLPDEPDQIFEALVIQVPEFVVTTGAPEPDEIFVVDIQNDAPPANKTYGVISAEESFEVITADTFEVTVAD